jgi:gamma-glutamyl:cysteine ligase YbdK (ATP-grasp superfamily)
MTLPAWARWSEAAAEHPWTVGIEEEVVLLDPRRDWSVANRIDDVLAALPPEVAAGVSAETHACVVELKTATHQTVAAAGAELALLRQALDRALRHSLGLRAAAVGMHPTAAGSEVALSAGARCQQIGATMGALARREPTMAQHVHVAVPDAACAVRALDGLRADLPQMLALSANSPFWCGRDSGFASIRTPIENRFLAARDGVRAQLIDDRARIRRPASDALTELFDDCRPVAERLGCACELEHAEALARDDGAARQRRHVRRAGLAGLSSWLAAEFAPAAQLTAAA